jgi:hypothetical protein
MKKIMGVYDGDSLNFHRIKINQDGARGQIYIQKSECVPKEILVIVVNKRKKGDHRGGMEQPVSKINSEG